MPIDWKEMPAFTRLLAAMVAAQDMKVCKICIQLCLLLCDSRLPIYLRNEYTVSEWLYYSFIAARSLPLPTLSTVDIHFLPF